MMKRALRAAGFMILTAALLLGLAACKNTGKEQSDGSRYFIVDEGSFTVPKGYFKNEKYSEAEVYYFYRDGAGKDEYADNISVSYGENPELEKGREAFEKAVMKQLKANAKEYKERTYEFTSYEAETKSGYSLLVFEVRYDKDILAAVQYLILDCPMSDGGYMSVELSLFEDKETEKLMNDAMAIVDSFEWKEVKK